MPTPTVTIRIAADQHQILRDVASRLKADPDFGGVLADLLKVEDHRATIDAPVVEPDILARIQALEAAVAKLTPRLGRPKFSDAARAKAQAFRDEVAAFAKAEKVTVAELARRLATAQGIAEKSAAKVLRGERPGSIEAMAQARKVLGMGEV